MVQRLPQTLATAIGLAVIGLAGCATTSPTAPLSAVFDSTVDDDGRTVLFDAAASTGPIVEYHWNFGDGTTGRGATAHRTYNQTDTAAFASLLVLDDHGGSAVAFERVPLGTGENQAPVTELSQVNRWVAPGDAVRLEANVSDPDDDSVRISWMFGPLRPETPPEARYETGRLGPGEEAEGRFDIQGVYLLASPEHSWMRTRLVVAEDGDAPTNATVTIRNHAIHKDADIRLAPGGTLRVVNEDPENRSVAVVFFAPGQVVGSEPSFTTPPLEAGSYQASVVLDDGKGGTTWRSWGLRASTDAPGLPDRAYSGQNIVQQGEHLHHPFPGDVLFEAHAWANATWEAAPAPDPQVHLAATIRDTEQVVGSAGECDAQRCSWSGMLPPGSYDWEIEFEAGLFESSEITTSYVVFGVPPDGHAEWSQPHGPAWA